jgi:hypothetical protein
MIKSLRVGAALGALLIAGQAYAQVAETAGSGPMPDLLLPAPDAPPIWSNQGVAYRAALTVTDAGLAPPGVDDAAGRLVGAPGAHEASGLQIESAMDDFNGLVVQGPGAHYRLSRSRINLSGDGSNDFAGLASGVLVDRGELDLDRVDIRTTGLISSAVTATNHGRLRVYDSVLESGGAPLPADYRPMLGPGMKSPPPGLNIEGTGRTVVLLDNSDTYFRNVKIIGHGWGALSTDGANGYLYLQADRSQIEMTGNGYGAYLDFGARALFNDTRVTSRGVGVFIAGAANLVLDRSYLQADRDALIFHSVMVKENDIGLFSATGGRIVAGGAIARVRSANAELTFDGVALQSGSGELVVAEVNPDFFATKITRRPPGVRVLFRDLEARGAVINRDGQREMSLSLRGAALEGPLHRVNLDLDDDSRWLATANSDVELVEADDLDRIDAKAGVTVRVRLNGPARVQRSPSGGRLDIN